jgi:Uma2 family endonuclease
LIDRTYHPGVAAVEEIHRWRPEEYHALIESGALEEKRVELLDGFIVDVRPPSPPHEYAIQWLNHAILPMLDTARHQIRVNLSLSLGASEPVPDIAVIPVDVEAPWHPGGAALAIEVSVSSRSRDLNVKPRIYADAGVPRYWMIDLDQRRAVIHTQPGAAGYDRIETVGHDGTLVAPEVGVSIGLGELLAFALR